MKNVSNQEEDGKGREEGKKEGGGREEGRKKEDIVFFY